MFHFLKKDKQAQISTSGNRTLDPSVTKGNWLTRLKLSLNKTQAVWTNTLSSFLLGKKQIDEALLNKLETLLLTADVGYHTTQTLLKTLVDRIGRDILQDEQLIFKTFKRILKEILEQVHEDLTINTENKPTFILLIGSNGSGKTTSIGKLAHRLKQNNLNSLLAAGDTFRAAAIEQLQTWGKNNQINVIAQQAGADSAAVIYDALHSAQSNPNIDVVIADTAGRLHTQQHLMEELKKIVRVTQKLKANGPDEVLLVLDASFGQNALQQAKQYDEAIGIDGIILTKLDGTAKGGILFSLANELKKPIRFIGVGEQREDLQLFNPSAFIDILFGSIDE